jgi:CHAT domain-containing protein
MPDSRTYRLCAGLLLFLLLGCDTLPPTALVSGTSQEISDASKSTGKNQVGEDCEFRPDNAGTLDVNASRSYGVWCGSWQQPSAHIFEATQGQRAEGSLTSLATAGVWRTYLDRFLICDAPANTTILDGTSTVMLTCTRRNGGWPHIAFAATLEGKTYMVDGVPSSLPALETTVAVLSGRSAAAASSGRSSAAQLLAKRYGAQPFGSGDLDRYYGLMRLGNDKNGIDDFTGAEDAFRDALAVQQKILGVSNPGLAIPLMHLALQISNQQRYAAADGLFAQAAALVQRSSDPLMTAQLNYYLGLHASNQGDKAKAKVFAEAAARQYGEVVPTQFRASRGGAAGLRNLDATGSSPLQFQALDPVTETGVQGLIEVWRFEASLAYNAAAYEDARKFARQARALLDAGGFVSPPTLPRLTRIAALSDSGIGDAGGADRGLNESTQLFNRFTPNEKPLAITLLLAGREARARGDNVEALDRFRAAAALLRERHIFVTEHLLAPYLESLMDEAARRPSEAPAFHAEMFEAAQFVQSGLTAKYIAQATARLAAGDQKVSIALRQLQESDISLTTLKAERDVESQKPSALQDAKRLQEIDAAIVAAQQARADADSATQAAAPGYMQLIQAPAPASLVMKLLEPREGMLDIALGDSTSFGFLVTHDGVRPFHIALTTNEVARAVEHLRKTAEIDVDEKGQPTVPIFDVAAAHDLYRKLFGPVEAELKGLDRVVISSTGSLLSLPFEMLVTDDVAPVANGNYRAVPFMLKRFAMSYVPSPQSFVLLRQSTTALRAPQPYIGFGDFRPPTKAQLAASFPPSRCKSDLDTLSQMGSLPATRQEVTAAATILGAPSAAVVLGVNFNKAALRSFDLKQYRVVHFATHAFLPTELRCKSEPSLLVSVSPQAANSDEAFLGAGEVLSLDLVGGADLTILSACNTVNSAGGESLSGLTRSFFFAGAHGILATHWSVEDESAKFVITRTVANIRSDAAQKSTTETLRQAKIDVLMGSGERSSASIVFSHPFAWAPFVLIGDGLRGPSATAESRSSAPGRS